jgi:predicted Zn finger-like uncharacterized protein
MILTCPKCATRFFAADDAIGRAGRRVECDACHEVWFSGGDESERVEVPVVQDSTAPPLPLNAVRDVVHEIKPPTPTATRLFVERPAPVRTAGASRSNRVWIISLLVFALVIAAGVVMFQRQIENAFPGATVLYQTIGLRSSGFTGG